MASVLGIIVSVAGSVYAWIASRSKAAAEEIEKLEQRINEQDKQILLLKGTIEHMPDKDLVTDIRLALAELKGTVGQLGEKVAGVAHIVGVIDEAMRQNSK